MKYDTATLTSPLALRGTTLKNRIAMSPMCQYSADSDGRPTDWHLVHYGSRAALGAGLIVLEASAVEARGRITPWDLGLWNDAHIVGLKRIVDFVRAQGAAVGVQLAHAGRKASTSRPHEGSRALVPAEGGWTTAAPSAVPFRDGDPLPEALDEAGIRGVIGAFAGAARRAASAGFDAVEIHAAHGYLLHQFLSPISNRRTDRWGGDFAARIRLVSEVTAAVRAEWPAERPLLVRISATDWAEGGWTVEDSIQLAKVLKGLGADLIDVSSGGMVPHPTVPVGPGYQVPFAAAIRRESGLPVSAVGLITEVDQAGGIVAEGSADLVMLGRELLRNPAFPWQAAARLAGSPAAPKPAPDANWAEGPGVALAVPYLRGWPPKG